MTVFSIRACAVLLSAATIAAPAAAQQPASAQPGAGGAAPAGVALPTDYVVGPQDVLSIVIWREKDMSADVVVRPDGKISLPLVNEIQAAGYTPEALRAEIAKAASKFMKETPDVTVVVKEIKSRNVSITGQVARSGSYELRAGMTVLDLIALGGGLLEWAGADKVLIMRKEDGKDRTFRFNYKDVLKGKNLQQNILLKPGDIVVVP